MVAVTNGRLGISVLVAAALLLFLWLVLAGVAFFRDIKAQDDRLQEQWAGAVVVSVCRDGTRIYKLRDGTFRTGGWGSLPVANPDVCR